MAGTFIKTAMSMLVLVSLWLIFGGMAFLALYIWQVSLAAFLAIMVGTMAGLSILMFVFVTIAIYCRSRIRAQSKCELIDPGRDIIPEEFWDRVRQTVEDLAPCGFNVCGHFRMGERVSGTVSYVTLLENKKERDIARLAVVFVQSNKVSRVHAVLAIDTEFMDGTELVTANNLVLSHVPLPKNRVALWLPHLDDGGDLYRIHQQVARTLGLGEKRWTLDNDSCDYMDRFSNAEIARWVDLEYYQPDGTGELLRPTWKGAVLISWKMIPPMKTIYVAWRKHQTNKLLRKLEE
jgi:hypothetical protein